MASGTGPPTPRTDLGRIRLHDPAALRRPHELCRAERQLCGAVHWNEDFASFVVLGAAEVKEVLRQPEVFSSSNSRGGAAMAVEDQVRETAVKAPDMQDLVARGYGRNPGVRAGSNADPPRHTVQRTLISPAFSPRRVRPFGSDIERVAAGLLNDLDRHVGREQPVDLVRTFTSPLPLRVLAAVLGIEPERVDDYARWSVGLLKPVGRIAVEPDEFDDMVRCRKEFDRYFTDLIDDRLARPRDDFMTDFARGATSGAEPLSLDEMLALIEQFVIAGHETTTKLLGNMLLLLTEHPGLADRLRTDADALDSMIDETLRLEGPAQVLNRVALADTVVGGVEIPAGAPVMVFLGAANRDDATFPRPDRLELHRPGGRGHMGFGFGIHFCVGHALARLEAQVGIARFLERYDFTLPAGMDRDSVCFVPSFAMHGPLELPALLTQRPGDA